MLARRGVETAEQASSFLAPKVDDLHDPFLLDGMTVAIERLLKARSGNERVVVVGDYDVDGVTATALVVAVFEACGLDCRPILPHRIRDGYGFQPAQVEIATSLGATVIVTVDCGSSSYDAVALARKAGLDVVITDHHLPGAEHAADVVHINPHRPECPYPFGDLSGAGIALKLAIGFARRVGRSIDPGVLLRVAALGTIADMVPLRGENRTIAALGLESLASTRSVGLRALLEVSGIAGPIGSGDVGFRIGPRINAAGRMASPDAALSLLLTRDAAEARSLASRLDEWNSERQRAETEVVEAATEIFLAQESLPPVLVAWSSDWHRGVVGIAAGRLSRDFHRPTILLSVDGETATGSGRSIRDVHLHDFLRPWRDRLLRFGGHAQAIGLTVGVGDLPTLVREWNEAAAEWDPSVLVRRLSFEEEIEAAMVDESLLAEVRRLEPFGVGNPRPVFRLEGLRAASSVRLFGGGSSAIHLSVTARDRAGVKVSLVGWRMAERASELEEPFDILGRISFDTFLQRVILEIVDVRPAAVTA
jgi:single-stranded-DNA-specific exonuclease